MITQGRMIMWFCMLFWCYCTKKMGTVSQTIIGTVAAILRMWAGHERFVAMWGSWPSCRSRSHSEGYIYRWGRWSCHSLPGLCTYITMLLFNRDDMESAGMRLTLANWAPHMIYIYIPQRQQQTVSVWNYSVLQSYTWHPHITLRIHTLTHHAPPQWPHMHICTYIYIYSSCACVNVQ